MTRFKQLMQVMVAATALAVGASAAMANGAKIFVIGGKPDDPFWSIVKRGAEDAGKVAQAEGGKVVWLGPQNYDNLGVDAAELIRQAIDQKADAIVAPDWVPAAMTRPSRPLRRPASRSSFTTPAASRPLIVWAQ